MALESTEQLPLTPSQQERLERLRMPPATVPATIRLADQIDEACDVVDRDLVRVAMARHDEAAAWAVLCDRGWPDDVRLDGIDLTEGFGWLAAWSEFTSLPLEVTTPQDRKKLAWILERLALCEAPLKQTLPVGLWQVVGVLDAMGRATLSCALHALVACVEARTLHATAVARREELFERFALLRHQARSLGVRAPIAPQDVRAWRATAVVIRGMQP